MGLSYWFSIESDRVKPLGLQSLRKENIEAYNQLVDLVNGMNPGCDPHQHSCSWTLFYAAKTALRAQAQSSKKNDKQAFLTIRQTVQTELQHVQYSQLNVNEHLFSDWYANALVRLSAYFKRNQYKQLSISQFWVADGKYTFYSSMALIYIYLKLIPLLKKYIAVAKAEMQALVIDQESSQIIQDYQRNLEFAEQEVESHGQYIIADLLARLQVISQECDFAFDDLPIFIAKSLKLYTKSEYICPARRELCADSFHMMHQLVWKYGNQDQRHAIKNLVWFKDLTADNMKIYESDEELLIVPEKNWALLKQDVLPWQHIEPQFGINFFRQQFVLFAELITFNQLRFDASAILNIFERTKSLEMKLRKELDQRYSIPLSKLTNRPKHNVIQFIQAWKKVLIDCYEMLIRKKIEALNYYPEFAYTDSALIQDRMNDIDESICWLAQNTDIAKLEDEASKVYHDLDPLLKQSEAIFILQAIKNKKPLNDNQENILIEYISYCQSHPFVKHKYFDQALAQARVSLCQVIHVKLQQKVKYLNRAELNEHKLYLQQYGFILRKIGNADELANLDVWLQEYFYNYYLSHSQDVNREPWLSVVESVLVLIGNEQVQAEIAMLAKDKTFPRQDSYVELILDDLALTEEEKMIISQSKNKESIIRLLAHTKDSAALLGVNRIAEEKIKRLSQVSGREEIQQQSKGLLARFRNRHIEASVSAVDILKKIQ